MHSSSFVARLAAALLLTGSACACVGQRPALIEARAAAQEAYAGGPSTRASRAAAEQVRAAARAAGDSRESPAPLARLENLLFEPGVWLPAQIELDTPERTSLAGMVASYLREPAPAVREAALTVMARLVPGDARAPAESAPSLAHYIDRLLERRELGAYESRHRHELLATAVRMIDQRTEDAGARATVVQVAQDPDLRRLATQRTEAGWSGAQWAVTEAERLAAGWRPIGPHGPDLVGAP